MRQTSQFSVRVQIAQCGFRLAVARQQLRASESSYPDVLTERIASNVVELGQRDRDTGKLKQPPQLSCCVRVV